MLDIKMLNAMPEHTVFATGLVEDSPEGVNMTGSGRVLKWIAKKGAVDDWAIYIHYAHKSIQEIKSNGDKVMGENNIQKLVPCDDEVYKAYRK